MDLSRFIKEVRPTAGPVALADALKLDDSALAEIWIVTGTKEENLVETFSQLAPRLGYGSAMLYTGLTADDAAAIEKVAPGMDLRTWHGAPGVPEGEHCWIKSFYDGNTYWTHRPYLTEAVRRTTGPVLELGCGEGSTPILHGLCAPDRLLVTVDRDVEYIEKFTSLMSDTHKFEHMLDPAETKWLDETWSVVFVDHAPGESRARAIERARSKATYIVVHDSEDLGYGIESLLASFKYRKDFRRARPWTSVVSDTLEVW